MLPELRTEIPGPRSRELGLRLRRVESRNITMVNERWPVFWERAAGVNVWDADGNRFLDFTSGFGVAGLGHSFEAAREAVAAQSQRLIHAMGDVHPAEAKVELCEKLAEITFGRWGAGPAKVILGNTGSDAIEAALKTALMHSGKPGVLVFEGAYHGLGYGALEASALGFFRDPFRAQLGRFAVALPYPYCYRCPLGHGGAFALAGGEFPNCSTGCLEELRRRICSELRKREIGAILVEPIQGRAGEIVPPRDFLRLLRRICDEEKILLVADEIYTGLNRTGRLFACDHSGVVPDLVCVGKALTSGFPLSACVGRADVMDAWPDSTGEALHTSTFLGNPLGCAMALASLNEHAKPETAERVRTAAKHLRTGLEAIPSPRIGQVRGAGLLFGMELVDSSGAPDAKAAADCVMGGLQAGLILLAGGRQGNVLSFTPPFGIAPEESDFLAARIGGLLGAD
ncbi:MAG: aspartate aminotransferase family protein [Chthoniobacterales bacterium]|nr:aspartate aminotransferase family protein [Chthoniobacterales bacterium]